MGAYMHVHGLYKSNFYPSMFDLLAIPETMPIKGAYLLGCMAMFGFNIGA